MACRAGWLVVGRWYVEAALPDAELGIDTINDYYWHLAIDVCV